MAGTKVWSPEVYSTVYILKFTAITSRAQPRADNDSRTKLSASLVEDGELVDVVAQLTRPDPQDVDVLIEKEIALLLNVIDSADIEEADLMLNKRTISSLCLLYTSMVRLLSIY